MPSETNMDMGNTHKRHLLGIRLCMQETLDIVFASEPSRTHP